MLRIRRAARAQGISSRPVSRGDFAVEAEIADRILGDLLKVDGGGAVGGNEHPDGEIQDGDVQVAEVQSGEVQAGNVGDRRHRSLPLDVFDPLVLAPFVLACEEAVHSLVQSMDPASLVIEAMRPKIMAAVYPKALGVGEPDIGRARESALADVAVLAVEQSLFDVIRRFNLENDRLRPVSAHADPGAVDILDGKVRRPKKPRGEKGRENAARMRRMAHV